MTDRRAAHSSHGGGPAPPEISGGGLPIYYLACFDSTPFFGSTSTIVANYYSGMSNAASTPAQWLHYVAPGCGGLSIQMSGAPILGWAVTCNLSGWSGYPLIAISPVIPSPLTLCSGCQLILDLSNVRIFYGDWMSAPVPAAPELVNQQLALQGADLGTPGGCPGSPPFRLSDGVIVTIL